MKKFSRAIVFCMHLAVVSVFLEIFFASLLAMELHGGNIVDAAAIEATGASSFCKYLILLKT